MKNRKLNIRLSEDTIKIIKDKANNLNISQSEFVRMSIEMANENMILKRLNKYRNIV